jgi:hypothetical protein
MSKTASREVRLASRPNGIPTADNFTLARIELAPPQDGQVLVRNRYMSVDPYMRGRMNSGKSYVPPFEFEKEVGGYFKVGKVKHKETVVKGIDQAVGAFLGLFQGRNVGKMVIELA